MVALVRPVELEPSVVLTTTTAFVEAAAPPLAIPMVGLHPEMVPSMVEKRKSAGAPAARRKSVGLPLAMVPVGVPVGKVLLLGSALGMVTTSGLITPAPL